MAKSEWKPDRDYVMALKADAEEQGDEVKLRDRMTEMRRMVDLADAPKIPEQYRKISTEIRTPFVRDTWQRVAAAITRDPPVFHVEPSDPDSKESRAAANIAERWTEAAVGRLNYDLGEDVVYEAVKHLVRDQESVIKVAHRKDAWARFPRRTAGEPANMYDRRAEGYKKQAGLPFAWRVVDRAQLYFENGEYGDDWAIEYAEFATPILGNRYGMVVDAQDPLRKLRNPEYLVQGKPKPEGELVAPAGRSVRVEYWDADWWHTVVDGDDAPGFPRRNPYGRAPYFRAKIAEPVLYALRYLVPALDALLTMKLNWAYLASYPIPIITSNPGSLPDATGLMGETGEPTTIEWVMGQSLELGPGKDMKFLAPPPVGADLNDLIQILRSLIDVAGIPSVFRGIGGADQAGYAINQLISAANLTYRILTTMSQRQVEQAVSFLWEMVRKMVRQTTWVYEAGVVTDKGVEKRRAGWLGLSPEGSVTANVAPVTELAQLVCRFRPVLPTDEQSRAMIAQQLVNADRPLMSQRRALEKYIQEEDPDQILDEQWVERALDSDQISERIIQEAMEETRLIPKPPSQITVPAEMGGAGAPTNPMVQAPGQAAAGIPSVPGLNQPIIPQTPAGPPIGQGVGGGRPAGSFPGMPSGQQGA